MRAQVELPIKDIREIDTESEEVKNIAEKIWNAITKYVTAHVSIKEDGIFNDPDWPHLWDHERE